MWRYKKGKHAYRFQLQTFLQLLRTREIETGQPPPPTPLPPPPPPSSTSGWRGEGEARDAHVRGWREEERIWQETEVALQWVSAAVEEACWMVVKQDAKSSLRSQLACLNEVAKP